MFPYFWTLSLFFSKFPQLGSQISLQDTINNRILQYTFTSLLLNWSLCTVLSVLKWVVRYFKDTTSDRKLGNVSFPLSPRVPPLTRCTSKSIDRISMVHKKKSTVVEKQCLSHTLQLFFFYLNVTNLESWIIFILFKYPTRESWNVVHLFKCPKLKSWINFLNAVSDYTNK